MPWPLAPDLASGQRVVIDNTDGDAALGRDVCRRQAGGACADDQNIEMAGRGGHAAAPVTTRIPGAHSVWHATRWAGPSIATRHTWQKPMPHHGALRGPVHGRRETGRGAGGGS